MRTSPSMLMRKLNANSRDGMWMRWTLALFIVVAVLLTLVLTRDDESEGAARGDAGDHNGEANRPVVVNLSLQGEMAHHESNEEISSKGKRFDADGEEVQGAESHADEASADRFDVSDADMGNEDEGDAADAGLAPTGPLWRDVDVVAWRHVVRRRPSWLGAPQSVKAARESMTPAERRRDKLAASFFGPPSRGSEVGAHEEFAELDAVDTFASIQLIVDFFTAAQRRVAELAASASRSVAEVYFSMQKMPAVAPQLPETAATASERSTAAASSGLLGEGRPVTHLAIAAVVDDWVPCSTLKRHVLSAAARVPASSNTTSSTFLTVVFVLRQDPAKAPSATCTPDALRPKAAGVQVVVEFSTSPVFVVRLGRALRRLLPPSSTKADGSSGLADLPTISHVLTVRLGRGIDASMIFANVGRLLDRDSGGAAFDATRSAIFSCVQLHHGKSRRAASSASSRGSRDSAPTLATHHLAGDSDPTVDPVEVQRRDLEFKNKEFLLVTHRPTQEAQRSPTSATSKRPRRHNGFAPPRKRNDGLNLVVPLDAAVDEGAAILLSPDEKKAVSQGLSGTAAEARRHVGRGVARNLRVLATGYELLIETREGSRRFHFHRRGEGLDPEDARVEQRPLSRSAAFATPECFLATREVIEAAGMPDRYHAANAHMMRNTSFDEASSEFSGNASRSESSQDEQSTMGRQAPLTIQLVDIAIDRMAQRVAVLERLLVQLSIHHVYASREPSLFHGVLLDCRHWIGEAVGLYNMHREPFVFTRVNSDDNGFDINFFANQPEVALIAIEQAVAKLKLATISVWKALLFHQARYLPNRVDAEASVEYALMLSVHASSTATRLLTTVVDSAERDLALESESFLRKQRHVDVTGPDDSGDGLPGPKRNRGISTTASQADDLPMESVGALRLSGIIASRSEQYLTRVIYNHTRALVAWFSLCCWCCGFSNEIVHYLVPLQQQYETLLVTEPGCFCSGFPTYVERIINTTMATPSAFATTRQFTPQPVIWISHTTPNHYWHDMFRARRPDYFIGRSMFEFNTIPKPWLRHLHIANEIWVPSSFVYDAFRRSGVPESKLILMPEALDVHLYCPAAVFAQQQQQMDDERVSTRSAEFALPPGLAELNGVGRRNTDFFASNIVDLRDVVDNYKFLSIFKWELRKGWDILLKAYFSEFSRKDKVSLYIVTTIFTMTEKYEHTRDADAVLRWTNAIAMRMKKPLDQLPHVYVITAPMGEEDVAAIYRSADAFVLPTRGEGWGLPAIQAMSAGLPTISTNYSGNVDFMTEENSLLIRIDGLEMVPPDVGVLDADASMQWAIPSWTHTAERMRQVFDNPELGREIGRRARHHIVTHFSEEAIYSKWLGPRLAAIEELLKDSRRRL